MTGRETILRPPKVHELEVPEWGGTAYVRVMSGRQRDRFDEIVSSKSQIVGLRALVAAFCLCDEDGALLFSEDDLPELEEADANALTRVLVEAMRINRLRDQDFEELQGNSGGAPERRAWFTLAERLRSTVGDLQDRLDAAEFAEWIAYLSLEETPSVPPLPHPPSERRTVLTTQRPGRSVAPPEEIAGVLQQIAAMHKARKGNS